jgi:hypothetical protein
MHVARWHVEMRQAGAWKKQEKQKDRQPAVSRVTPSFAVLPGQTELVLCARSAIGTQKQENRKIFNG